jgi:Co/Zn/Cd efflux system component
VPDARSLALGGLVAGVVLAINTAMFFVEGVAGLRAHSTSLLADALDMLGRYSFLLAEAVANGGMRPLRNPNEYDIWA